MFSHSYELDRWNGEIAEERSAVGILRLPRVRPDKALVRPTWETLAGEIDQRAFFFSEIPLARLVWVHALDEGEESISWDLKRERLKRLSKNILLDPRVGFALLDEPRRVTLERCYDATKCHSVDFPGQVFSRSPSHRATLTLLRYDPGVWEWDLNRSFVGQTRQHLSAMLRQP